jgi:hypothetical protein
MRVRRIGTVVGVLLGAIGCMKTDRVVAVQMDMNMDGGWDIALGDVALEDIALGDIALGDIALGDAALGWRPFSTPTAVTGLVADTTDCQCPTLTADELELYFSCARQGEASLHIWTSTRASRDAGWNWNPATLVNEFVSVYNEQDPDVSNDGLTMYFASDQLGEGYQIYFSQRTTREQKWPKAVLVQGLGFSTAEIRGPSVNPSGLFMTFCSAPRGTEDFNLYSASRTDPAVDWGNVQPLSGINSGRADADPALFHDSLSLIWSSRAPSNGKSWDLVEVSRLDSIIAFSAPKITLDSLNTSVSERYPWVSQDGTHILFTREAVGAPGVIYEAWR